MNPELVALVQAAARASENRERAAVALADAHEAMEGKQAEYDAAAAAESTTMINLIGLVTA